MSEIYKPSLEELKEILRLHELWLRGENDGKRANLRDANLRGASLRGADLWGADLRGANLQDADLWGADLRGADLRGADLLDANLRGASLWGADLWGANLRGADLEINTALFVETEIVPREGSFIGWKKGSDGTLIKLLIMEDAQRTNAIGSRKCRCSQAQVLEIKKDGLIVQEAVSKRDKTFVYRTGEIVEVSDFCDDRRIECAEGIHFFITPEEAEAY